MQHEPEAEPAAAFLTRAADLEGLAGNTYCTADLGAPRTGEIDDATEPRSKDVWRCYGTHDTQLVSQQFGSGAIGENRPADLHFPVDRLRGR